MTTENTRTKRRFVRWGGLIVAALLGVVVLLILGVVAGGAVARARIRAQFPPSGQMVDVGGYRLHIDCQGEGSPTVVLLSGAGVPSSYWWLVQNELAQTTRVCAYDRAGYAWSEAGTGDMSPRGQVEDLKLLLAGSRVEPPYLLVGHSYGGYLARLYTQNHPAEVVGLVMVDSAHEQQYVRYPEPIRSSGQRMFTGPDSQLGRIALYLFGSLQAILPGNDPRAELLPPEIAAKVTAMSKVNPLILYTVKAEVSEMVAGRSPRVADLGDLPLIVITHEIPIPPAMGQSEEVSAEYERVSLEMQRELVSLSTRGRQVIAIGATHDDLPLKRADLVVGSVLEVRAEALGQTASAVPER